MQDTIESARLGWDIPKNWFAVMGNNMRLSSDTKVYLLAIYMHVDLIITHNSMFGPRDPMKCLQSGSNTSPIAELLRDNTNKHL